MMGLFSFIMVAKYDFTTLITSRKTTRRCSSRARRAHSRSILAASAPYIYFIHNQTRARKLPAELALIPVIESEFNPNDHSAFDIVINTTDNTPNSVAEKIIAAYKQAAQELGLVE